MDSGGMVHAAAIVAHDAELASVGITTVFNALRVGSIATRINGKHGEYARAPADDILALRAQGALGISHFLHLRAEICSETPVTEMARFGAGDLASHGDTLVPDVARSHAYGVTFAEFPTTHRAAAACRMAGIAVMMGAPNLIRGGSRSGNVAAQAQADLLDFRGHLAVGARGDVIRVRRIGAGATPTAALRGVWVQGIRVA